MLPRAVLLDNDGLLLDTETVWTRAEEALYARRGLDFTPEQKLRLVGTSAEIAGTQLEGDLGEPGRAEAIIAELDQLVMEELENGVEAMEGARELLAALEDAEVPMALVSNSPRRFIERALELGRIEAPFGAVVSGHEVAAPKPAPDPYLEACARIGVEAGPEVIVLEDSPTGVEAGVAAGLRVIGVPSVPGVALPRAHEELGSLRAPRLLALLGLAGAA